MTCGACSHFNTSMVEANGDRHGYGFNGRNIGRCSAAAWPANCYAEDACHAPLWYRAGVGMREFESRKPKEMELG